MSIRREVARLERPVRGLRGQLRAKNAPGTWVEFPGPLDGIAVTATLHTLRLVTANAA